jgi:hypothetical protein
MDKISCIGLWKSARELKKSVFNCDRTYNSTLNTPVTGNRVPSEVVLSLNQT